MDKDDIKFGDWHRILFGEAPPAYLLEVVVRVAIIYILILIGMRFLGKRFSAKVSRAEIVARVSIAAAVGLPIQRPGRGILSAAIVAFVVVAVGRFLAKMAFDNPRFERAFQGVTATLISDGVMDVDRMAKIRITRDRLFAELRGDGLKHLGQVKRLYMEANGDFSLVKNDEEVPGLSIIPEWDTELCQRQQKTDTTVCKNCGDKWDAPDVTCRHCGGREQQTAILLPEEKEEAVS